MKITVTSRNKSKNFPLQLEFPADATVDDLVKAIHSKFPRYTPHRQRLTKDGAPLEQGKTLAACGIKDGDSVALKDLGPQIGWKTVFLVEYFGPILVHPIFYYYGEQIYGKKFEHSQMQTVAFYLVLLHFIKRELETLFVHRFSHATMPFINIFKNSAHYHILSGVNLAYWVYGPWAAMGTGLGSRSEAYILACVGIWAWGEISNFVTHMTLRNLRPPGTRVRKVPYGYGFDLVSCPNYFFETVAWVAYSFLTQSWAAWLFTIVAVGQMYIWAEKKHRNYRKEFKDYPLRRRAMFPYLA
ncbi:uncharacterized protein VTP21DRAFT_5400 [Calcarisporiella thermophila]|uniref:uncharacterized protein n=1 Tax=Calcarisporiella thermophila TaxID=911321 RepID=UPI003744496F